MESGVEAVDMTADAYVVEIEDSVPGLPPLVGPFQTHTAAEDWGLKNIANGAWNVAPVAHPSNAALR